MLPLRSGQVVQGSTLNPIVDEMRYTQDVEYICADCYLTDRERREVPRRPVLAEWSPQQHRGGGSYGRDPQTRSSVLRRRRPMRRKPE